jgi:fucose 4-O-acetylase-like acetyltransferase
MTTSEKRLLWLDYAKLISVAMVAFVHIPLAEGDKSWHCFATAIDVNIFFIISGFLAKTESVRTTLKKTKKSLLTPYLCLYLITYTYWLQFLSPFLPECDDTFLDKFIKPMLGLFIGEPAKPSDFYQFTNGSLWFLIGLFLCKIMFSAIVSVFKKATELALAVSVLLAITFTYYFAQTDYNLLFSLDSAIMGFPLFVFGYYLKRLIDSISLNKFQLLALSAVCLVSVWLLSQWNGEVHISRCIYGRNLAAYYLVAVVGSIGLLAFTMLFSTIRIPLLLYLGESTILIMAFHTIIFSIIRMLYSVLVGANMRDVTIAFLNGINVWIALVLVIITVISSLIPIYVINRYFPFVVGKTKS